MAQPPGFIDSLQPKHVCHLHKAIYGLKQAPRAWYTELKKFLISYCFVNSKSDASLFIYNMNSLTIYLLVYVVGLLVTSNSKSVIHGFIHASANRFSIKDLGAFNFFLGIEAIPTLEGLFSSQHKYVRELLDRHNMVGAKESTTPLSTSTKLVLKDGSSSTDSKQYRSLIGALQYLALTRPYISYFVNKLAQFIHAPSQKHWSAAKQLIRYLKSTIYFGLHLRQHQSLYLEAFSNAD